MKFILIILIICFCFIVSLFFGRIERYYYPRYTIVRRHARKGTRGVRSHSRRISDGVRFIWVPHYKKYKSAPNKKALKKECSKASSKIDLKGIFKQQPSINNIKTTSEINHQDIPNLQNSLNSYKTNILSAIKTKTLSHEQSSAVWENRSRYDFTAQELDKLEKYNNEIRLGKNLYVCGQCGLVSSDRICVH